MKRTIETKFYTFLQNNSGGAFNNDPEAGIGEVVIIEAADAVSANTIAKSIGLYFDGCDTGADCPCCGDRWYKADEDDGYSVPSIWGKPLDQGTTLVFAKNCYVHSIDRSFTHVVIRPE